MARFAIEGSTIVFDDGGMNLLSSDALRELRAIVDAWSAPMLIFRSGRASLFAAGADMAEMSRFTPRDAEAFAFLGQQTFEAIERLPCPTTAIVDGDCFGGALDLTLAFDLRFATPRSRFSHPGSRIGIVTGFGGTSRWRKLITRGAARRLFLGNPILTADDALQIGLVDRVGESFDDELQRIAALDPMTARLVKELARHSESLSREQLQLLAERLARLYDVSS